MGCSWPAVEANEGTDARFEVSEDCIPLEKGLDRVWRRNEEAYEEVYVICVMLEVCIRGAKCVPQAQKRFKMTTF